MKAPIKRVLPTPVAKAKVSDINSRSKSEQIGYIAWTAPNAAFKFIPFRKLTLLTISSSLSICALISLVSSSVREGTHFSKILFFHKWLTKIVRREKIRQMKEMKSFLISTMK